MSNEVTIRPAGEVSPLSANGVREQVNLIQEVMSGVMVGPSKENPTGVHYGVIPGTGNKPSLYKAGAEKLSLVFRLRPIMNDAADIEVIDLPNLHREYRVKCHILAANGLEIATGVGSCSTMESKYRYRREASYEVLDENIPDDYRAKKDDYRKKGFGAKQIDNAWRWVKYAADGRKENPDIADVYNTVLKMAKKRAYVDGILSATAASDIFTQDVEDLPQGYVSEIGRKPAQPATEAPPAGVQRKSEATKAEAAAADAHGDDKGGGSREAAGNPERETVRATVEKKYATKGKFVAYGLDNGLRVQTSNEAIIDIMNEAGRQKAPVDITFDVVQDGKFTNRDIVDVVIHEGSAAE